MGKCSRRTFVVGGFGCLLAACTQARAGEMGYSIAVSGEGNQVAISRDASRSENAYIATIYSTGGMGQASAVWWGDTSPHHLYFYLHLNGLEQFSLRWVEQTVTLSVSSLDQTVLQRLQVRHQSEEAITADSPYWMEVLTPTPATPMYKLKAPAAFLATAPKFWGIEWIDFYR